MPTDTPNNPPSTSPSSPQTPPGETPTASTKTRPQPNPSIGSSPLSHHISPPTQSTQTASNPTSELTTASQLLSLVQQFPSTHRTDFLSILLLASRLSGTSDLMGLANFATYQFFPTKRLLPPLDNPGFQNGPSETNSSLTPGAIARWGSLIAQRWSEELDF